MEFKISPCTLKKKKIICTLREFKIIPEDTCGNQNQSGTSDSERNHARSKRCVKFSVSQQYCEQRTLGKGSYFSDSEGDQFVRLIGEGCIYNLGK